MEIINNNEKEPLNILNLLSQLIQKTKKSSYLTLFLSILGISPETIDKSITKERKIERNTPELGM